MEWTLWPPKNLGVKDFLTWKDPQEKWTAGSWKNHPFFEGTSSEPKLHLRASKMFAFRGVFHFSGFTLMIVRIITLIGTSPQHVTCFLRNCNDDNKTSGLQAIVSWTMASCLPSNLTYNIIYSPWTKRKESFLPLPPFWRAFTVRKKKCTLSHRFNSRFTDWRNRNAKGFSTFMLIWWQPFPNVVLSI